MNKKTPFGHIDACQICGHKKLKTVLAFGHQAIVQRYLTAKQLHQPETVYPLNFCFCPKCGLSQLDYVVDPKIVFPANYPYRTHLTNMLVRNFRELADSLGKRYRLKKSDLVIDIGSNDGTLLEGFKAKGMRVLGIEPTDVAKEAKRNGIPTIQAYFNEQTAQAAAKKYGRAKIVTMTNSFAHIPDPLGIVRGIGTLLADDGIFVSESQYLMSMMQTLELDTIYHEHLRFYALKPLQELFRRAGFSLVDAKRISAAGGSIRVFAMKGKKPASSRTKKLLAEEEAAGLYDVKKMRRYAQKMIDAKNALLVLLIKCKQSGARIAGVSSAGRSNTLLNFAKIDSTLLDYTGEKSGSPKIGLFTPGAHILVVDEKQLLKDQPEYALMLSWHIGQELMKKLRATGFKGKFILPLPKIKIVN